LWVFWQQSLTDREDFGEGSESYPLKTKENREDCETTRTGSHLLEREPQLIVDIELGDRLLLLGRDLGAEIAGGEDVFAGLRDDVTRPLAQLIRHCKPAEFATNRFDYDSPADNGGAYLHFRERLVWQINRFVDPSAPRDQIRNPFVPETDTDALIEIEEALVLKEAKLVQYLKVRSRSAHSRADFICALAEIHRTIGDDAEAERLMHRPQREAIRSRSTGARKTRRRSPSCLPKDKRSS
jgi:hypothetical protein